MSTATSMLPTRRIGEHTVGCLGFGAMRMGSFYGPPVSASVVAELLDTCLQRGMTLIDTADIYSPYHLGKMGFNERQIGHFLASNPQQRSKMFICTKFGLVFNGKGGLDFRGDREYVFNACEDSLQRLGVDQIDLYYAHRAIPGIEVAETVGAMKELKEQGKIRYIGVSEYNLQQLEQANQVVHIDAIQIEVSAWTPDVLTNGILQWCEKNDTALIAYSPLGRGFLTGQYKSLEDFEANDSRRTQPRFQGENFSKNLELVKEIQLIANKKHATSGQIALAWLLGKSDSIIPIPGTKMSNYLDENIGAGDIRLNQEELAEIDNIINSFHVVGPRYTDFMQKFAAF